MNAVTPISFTGQVAVVTGGGRGLGRTYAMEFARRGAYVVVNSRAAADDGPASAEIVAGEIVAMGGSAVASVQSVADSTGPSHVIDTALDSFGRVDVLVNNAGNAYSAPIEDLDVDALRDVLATHVLGPAMMSRYAFGAMRANGYGRIVNISSHAIFGRAAGVAYGAAKAAVLGLTNALAVEGAEHGILVNAVLPVAVTGRSRLLPGQALRIAEMMGVLDQRRDPAFVTPLAVFLASDACTTTGNAYAAIAGNFARISVGMTPGWWAIDAMPTAEDVATHLVEIDDLGGVTFPDSLYRAFSELATAAPLTTPLQDGS